MLRQHIQGKQPKRQLEPYDENTGLATQIHSTTTKSVELATTTTTESASEQQQQAALFGPPSSDAWSMLRYAISD